MLKSNQIVVIDVLNTYSKSLRLRENNGDISSRSRVNMAQRVFRIDGTRGEARDRAISVKSVSLKAVEQRRKLVESYYSDSESPSDDGQDSDTKEGKGEIYSIVTHEYWYIIKAMKFLRIGNPNACFTALACISECDLRNATNVTGVMIDNGLETLVNLTEVNHPTCVIGALNVLKKITHHWKVIRLVVDYGICTNLVTCLSDMNPEINCLACDIIANLGRYRLAALNVRKCGGIRILVELLKLHKQVILLLDERSLTKKDKMNIRKSHCAAWALCSLCAFTKNKKAAQKAGVIPIMSQLILSGNLQVALPMTGMLCECSSEIYFQRAIETDGLVGVLLHDMRKHDMEFSYMCANALANAADGNKIVCHMIRYHRGLDLVMELLKVADRHDVRFIAALLKLIWKSANVIENVKRYEFLNTSSTLMEYIASNEVSWRTPATGAVGELAKCHSCRERLLNLNVIQALVSNFGSANTQLVINTACAIGELVRSDEKAMKTLEANDGVRLMWSLLNHQSQEVKVQALNSLVPLLAQAEEAGELVRSLNNSLHLLVRTLQHGHKKLLGGCCRLVAQVAKDKENLMVMTQHGLVQELSRLTIKEGIIMKETLDNLNTSAMKDIVSQYSKFDAFLDEDPDGVRESLAQAIANCSVTAENSLTFGIAGVISVLSMFLQTRNATLKAQTCAALWELSRIELNCIQIHLCGAVPALIEIMSSKDPFAQISASGALANIRRCLLANDLMRFKYGDLPDNHLMERKEIPLK